MRESPALITGMLAAAEMMTLRADKERKPKRKGVAKSRKRFLKAKKHVSMQKASRKANRK